MNGCREYRVLHRNAFQKHLLMNCLFIRLIFIVLNTPSIIDNEMNRVKWDHTTLPVTYCSSGALKFPSYESDCFFVLLNKNVWFWEFPLCLDFDLLMIHQLKSNCSCVSYLTQHRFGWPKWERMALAWKPVNYTGCLAASFPDDRSSIWSPYHNDKNKQESEPWFCKSYAWPCQEHWAWFPTTITCASHNKYVWE